MSINQETFDNAVKENMEEFEMTLEEAIQDTIKEFEAQGVDLSNVIVDLMAHSKENQELIDIVHALKEKEKNNEHPGDCIPEMAKIENHCKKSLPARVIAGKEGVYDVLLKLCHKALNHPKNPEILQQCLKTLIALMTKQPDLLNEQGVQLIIQIVDTEKDQLTLQLALKWTKECCVLHEHNRQNIFDAGILDHLKPLLGNASSDLLTCVLGVLRALVLDDDVRVEFGKAHEHARTIASDTLCAIAGLLERFKKDENLMNELMLTLSALLVRTEFCKKVDDAGGVDIIQGALTEFYDNEKVTRQCLKVLKALAGNDECKSKIIKNGAGPLIISSLNKHKASAQTDIIGLGCIAALTLRSPDNSNALFECGAPKVIVDIMRLHVENEQVQRNAGWAVRNMVSRSRHQNKEFINLGIEQLFKTAMKKFKNSEYDIKAALRDLECDVNFKEEWTGKGGRINTDARN